MMQRRIQQKILDVPDLDRVTATADLEKEQDHVTEHEIERVPAIDLENTAKGLLQGLDHAIDSKNAAKGLFRGLDHAIEGENVEREPHLDLDHVTEGEDLVQEIEIENQKDLPDHVQEIDLENDVKEDHLLDPDLQLRVHLQVI